MVFTSPRFVVFLILLLFILALVRHRDANKRILALASCLFYAAWDWRYLGLLLAVSVIDYFAANQIVASPAKPQKRRWLLVSMVSNLGLLAYFKYCNFFIGNLNALTAHFGFVVQHVDILLPAGISFYTFKTMSYTIDVYRGHLRTCTSWLDYVTFVTFFPELIAGPIVRGSVFLPQMDRRIGPTTERVITGSSLFLLGLIKKLFIADRLSGIGDSFFATPELFTSATAWCAVVAYTIQIYCDFSGYSDMAVGAARMIGYDLPENFRMPYLSLNITEFWRRWHMTLSAWLRDYLYIPLGGNRGGAFNTYRNLFLTMLLGGLWHGASWNFVAWGGLHGSALATHKLWTKHGAHRIRIPAILGWLATLLFVVLCWVPFRSRSFHDTWIILQSLVCVSSGKFEFIPFWLFVCLPLCIVGHWLGVLWLENSQPLARGSRQQKLLDWLGFNVEHHPVSGAILSTRRATPAGIYVVGFVLLMLFFFAPLNTSPFIYFQF